MAITPYLRPVRKDLLERNLVAMALRLSGLSLRQVGNMVGISPEQVRQKEAKFVRWGKAKVDAHGDQLRALNIKIKNNFTEKNNPKP